MTGSWFIGSKKFIDWKNSPNSFLWLHGIPGCGKTILSSTIIEEALKHCGLNLSVGVTPTPLPMRVVVYFYFDFTDNQKRIQENMIRSSIKQLSQNLPYTSVVLESLFSSCTNGNRQPTIEALRKILVEMIKEFEQVFLILDALDECKDRQELIKSINEITRSDLPMLHVLTTSRMERDIEDGLSNLTDEQKIYIQSDFVQADIRDYIYARLQTDTKLWRLQRDHQDQQAIVDTMMKKADGM